MSKTRKKFVAALAVCSAATVFQTGLAPAGCAQFALTYATAAFDACAVLNCSGSSFFDFCDPVVTFIDCPNVGGGNP